jgi:hypothetical protein
MQQNLFLYTLKENIVWKSVILGMQNTKSRAFPWVLFMMITTLTLGRAMKKKREIQMGSLYPALSL